MGQQVRAESIPTAPLTWLVRGLRRLTHGVEHLRRIIPEGRPLREDAWWGRHRMILALLGVQAVALPVFGAARGYGIAHSSLEGLPVAATALLAMWPRLSRTTRSCVATFGLVTSSAILVHLSGGTIEAHFHFFVILGVISLYQSWAPFLLALGYVVAHHGLVGYLDPDAVFNHPAAWASPWKWAAIHGGFVLAASAAQLVAWSFSENARTSFEMILESAGEGMVGSDTQGRVTFLNRAGAAMLGVEDPSAFVGSPVSDLLDWTLEGTASQPATESPLAETLRTGAPHTSRTVVLGRKDHRFPAEMITTPIGRRGEIEGAVVVFRDVTDERRGERERTETLSLLEATLESTADGILVVDNAGAIMSFNRKFVEMWRIPEEIIASRNDDQALAYVLGQLKHPEAFLAKVRELYATPDAESNDVLEFIDGRVFERYSQPQWVEDRCVGRVWSFRDVTERSKLDQMKDGFLSAVSHELRTPLTNVLGFTLTLQQRAGELTEHEREDVLERLGMNARKLQRLLTDILDLDRLGRGILEPRRERTDLGELVRRVVEESGVRGQRPINVTDEGVVVGLDQAKVERIVENLITNVIRHTPSETRLWIEVRARDRGALLVVSDEGPGVPEEFRAAIFESFHQGPNVTTHAPGVGIGLSLVARFAELHGGRAWVEDREGGGASFMVFLPDAPARTGEAGGASPSPVPRQNIAS